MREKKMETIYNKCAQNSAPLETPRYLTHAVKISFFFSFCNARLLDEKHGCNIDRSLSIATCFISNQITGIICILQFFTYDGSKNKQKREHSTLFDVNN